MANFFDTVKDFIHGSTMTNAGADEDWDGVNGTDLDEYENNYESYENEYEEAASPAREKIGLFGRSHAHEDEEVEFSEPRVVEFAPYNERVNRQHVISVRPQSLEDSEQISRELRAGRLVICNFEGMDIRTSQRIMDFLAGAAFALDGRVMTISAKVFLIAPRHMDVSEGLSQQQEDQTMEKLRRAAIG